MVYTELVSVIDSAPLPESEKYYALDALTDIPEAVLWFTQKHQAKTLKAAPAKKRSSDDENGYEYGYINRHGLLL